jgi:hypothetical protein
MEIIVGKVVRIVLEFVAVFIIVGMFFLLLWGTKH